MRGVELEFRGVTKRYGPVRGDGSDGRADGAVNDLSFTVPAGQICVLVGPSGCGKTTSLKMVNRLVEPTAGQILLGGRDVMAEDPIALRRGIGYVIQQVGLLPHLTVADNVATVPRLLGWPAARRRERVNELMAMVGLPAEYGGRYPTQLSGGERQRVGVARALAADPPLLLMDEPFGAVDPIVRERLQNELLSIQARLAKTILFVTHDIDEAIKMGDRIAVMQVGGKLEQYARPAELLMAPATEFVEDFVGADRALKRLALQRVRDIDLWTVATCRTGESTAEVRKRIAEADLDIPLLIDAQQRPVGWLSARALLGERVRDELRSRADPVVELDDILRDALSDLLAKETMYGPVVDASGRAVGVLSIQVISQAVGGAAEVPSPTELVDAATEPEPRDDRPAAAKAEER